MIRRAIVLCAMCVLGCGGPRDHGRISFDDGGIALDDAGDAAEPDACVPLCEGRGCGGDGCGGDCGTCGWGETCSPAARCEPACVPDCDGRTCGLDGCEGSCGACASNELCTDSGCSIDCTPRPEQCNGIDDDCDGATDEGIDARGCADPRYPAGTACHAGTQQCFGGRWGSCSGPLPVREGCNGADDDCDGATDEDFGGQRAHLRPTQRRDRAVLRTQR